MLTYLFSVDAKPARPQDDTKTRDAAILPAA